MASLRAAAAKGGAAGERFRHILASAPRAKPEDEEYLNAYNELDDGRCMGAVAPNPIPTSEIVLYCVGVGVASPDARAKYLRLIRRMDRAYLAHWAENNKKK